MYIFCFPSCHLGNFPDVCLHFWIQHVSILEAFTFSASSGLDALSGQLSSLPLLGCPQNRLHCRGHLCKSSHLVLS